MQNRFVQANTFWVLLAGICLGYAWNARPARADGEAQKFGSSSICMTNLKPITLDKQSEHAVFVVNDEKTKTLRVYEYVPQKGEPFSGGDIVLRASRNTEFDSTLKDSVMLNKATHAIFKKKLEKESKSLGKDLPGDGLRPVELKYGEMIREEEEEEGETEAQK